MPQQSSRGGRREGAGRPKKEKLVIGGPGNPRGIATRVLNAIDEEKWWLALLHCDDKRLRFDVQKYLTDRRDGKPAQGVFVGDTREKNIPELEFGNLLIGTTTERPAGGKPGEAGKPN
jgi:hypothetical protein